MADYASLVEAFGHDERFTLDTGSTTLFYLPRAATLLYDANTTTGQMFMLATGQKAICLPTSDPSKKISPHAHVASTPDEVSAAVAMCLAQLEQGEVPELRHLRESILYRPGETRHLFWQYLADILRGTVPPQAVAIACEYIGDCCPASRNDELALLLQRLAAGTVERSYNLFREYPFYSELESVYRALHIRRDKGLPCLVRLGQQSDGYQQVEVCPDEAQDMPFLCWGSLRYYGPPGLMHIQKHASQRLAAPTAGCAILLPDRNKELFCQAFTELLVAVYGRPEALSQS